MSNYRQRFQRPHGQFQSGFRPRFENSRTPRPQNRLRGPNPIRGNFSTQQSNRFEGIRQNFGLQQPGAFDRQDHNFGSGVQSLNTFDGEDENFGPQSFSFDGEDEDFGLQSTTFERTSRVSQHTNIFDRVEQNFGQHSNVGHVQQSNRFERPGPKFGQQSRNLPRTVRGGQHPNRFDGPNQQNFDEEIEHGFQQSNRFDAQDERLNFGKQSDNFPGPHRGGQNSNRFDGPSKNFSLQPNRFAGAKRDPQNFTKNRFEGPRMQQPFGQGARFRGPRPNQSTRPPGNQVRPLISDVSAQRLKGLADGESTRFVSPPKPHDLHTQPNKYVPGNVASNNEKGVLEKSSDQHISSAVDDLTPVPMETTDGDDEVSSQEHEIQSTASTAVENVNQTSKLQSSSAQDSSKESLLKQESETKTSATSVNNQVSSVNVSDKQAGPLGQSESKKIGASRVECGASDTPSGKLQEESKNNTQVEKKESDQQPTVTSIFDLEFSGLSKPKKQPKSILKKRTPAPPVEDIEIEKEANNDQNRTGMKNQSEPDTMYSYCDLCSMDFTSKTAYENHVAGLLHTSRLNKGKPPKQQQQDEILTGEAPSFRPSPVPNEKSKMPKSTKTQQKDSSKGIKCKLCNIECTGPQTWEQHINGIKHIQRYNQTESELGPALFYERYGDIPLGVKNMPSRDGTPRETQITPEKERRHEHSSDDHKRNRDKESYRSRESSSEDHRRSRERDSYHRKSADSERHTSSSYRSSSDSHQHYSHDDYKDDRRSEDRSYTKSDPYRRRDDSEKWESDRGKSDYYRQRDDSDKWESERGKSDSYRRRDDSDKWESERGKSDSYRRRDDSDKFESERGRSDSYRRREDSDKFESERGKSDSNRRRDDSDKFESERGKSDSYRRRDERENWESEREKLNYFSQKDDTEKREPNRNREGVDESPRVVFDYGHAFEERGDSPDRQQDSYHRSRHYDLQDERLALGRERREDKLAPLETERNRYDRHYDNLNPVERFERDGIPRQREISPAAHSQPSAHIVKDNPLQSPPPFSSDIAQATLASLPRGHQEIENLLRELHVDPSKKKELRNILKQHLQNDPSLDISALRAFVTDFISVQRLSAKWQNLFGAKPSTGLQETQSQYPVQQEDFEMESNWLPGLGPDRPKPTPSTLVQSFGMEGRSGRADFLPSENLSWQGNAVNPLASNMSIAGQHDSSSYLATQKPVPHESGQLGYSQPQLGDQHWQTHMQQGNQPQLGHQPQQMFMQQRSQPQLGHQPSQMLMQQGSQPQFGHEPQQMLMQQGSQPQLGHQPSQMLMQQGSQPQLGHQPQQMLTQQGSQPQLGHQPQQMLMQQGSQPHLGHQPQQVMQQRNSALFQQQQQSTMSFSPSQISLSDAAQQQIQEALKKFGQQQPLPGSLPSTVTSNTGFSSSLARPTFPILNSQAFSQNQQRISAPNTASITSSSQLSPTLAPSFSRNSQSQLPNTSQNNPYAKPFVPQSIHHEQTASMPVREMEMTRYGTDTVSSSKTPASSGLYEKSEEQVRSRQETPPKSDISRFMNPMSVPEVHTKLSVPKELSKFPKSEAELQGFSRNEFVWKKERKGYDSLNLPAEISKKQSDFEKATFYSDLPPTRLQTKYGSPQVMAQKSKESFSYRDELPISKLNKADPKMSKHESIRYLGSKKSESESVASAIALGLHGHQTVESAVISGLHSRSEEQVYNKKQLDIPGLDSYVNPESTSYSQPIRAAGSARQTANQPPTILHSVKRGSDLVSLLDRSKLTVHPDLDMVTPPRKYTPLEQNYPVRTMESSRPSSSQPSPVSLYTKTGLDLASLDENKPPIQMQTTHQKMRDPMKYGQVGQSASRMKGEPSQEARIMPKSKSEIDKLKHWEEQTRLFIQGKLEDHSGRNKSESKKSDSKYHRDDDREYHRGRSRSYESDSDSDRERHHHRHYDSDSDYDSGRERHHHRRSSHSQERYRRDKDRSHSTSLSREDRKYRSRSKESDYRREHHVRHSSKELQKSSDKYKIKPHPKDMKHKLEKDKTTQKKSGMDETIKKVAVDDKEKGKLGKWKPIPSVHKENTNTLSKKSVDGQKGKQTEKKTVNTKKVNVGGVHKELGVSTQTLKQIKSKEKEGKEKVNKDKSVKGVMDTKGKTSQVKHRDPVEMNRTAAELKKSKPEAKKGNLSKTEAKTKTGLTGKEFGEKYKKFKPVGGVTLSENRISNTGQKGKTSSKQGAKISSEQNRNTKGESFGANISQDSRRVVMKDDVAVGKDKPVEPYKGKVQAKSSTGSLSVQKFENRDNKQNSGQKSLSDESLKKVEATFGKNKSQVELTKMSKTGDLRDVIKTRQEDKDLRQVVTGEAVVSQQDRKIEKTDDLRNLINTRKIDKGEIEEAGPSVSVTLETSRKRPLSAEAEGHQNKTMKIELKSDLYSPEQAIQRRIVLKDSEDVVKSKEEQYIENSLRSFLSNYEKKAMMQKNQSRLRYEDSQVTGFVSDVDMRAAVHQQTGNFDYRLTSQAGGLAFDQDYLPATASSPPASSRLTYIDNQLQPGVGTKDVDLRTERRVVAKASSEGQYEFSPSHDSKGMMIEGERKRLFDDKTIESVQVGLHSSESLPGKMADNAARKIISRDAGNSGHVSRREGHGDKRSSQSREKEGRLHREESKSSRGKDEEEDGDLQNMMASLAHMTGRSADEIQNTLLTLTSSMMENFSDKQQETSEAEDVDLGDADLLRQVQELSGISDPSVIEEAIKMVKGSSPEFLTMFAAMGQDAQRSDKCGRSKSRSRSRSRSRSPSYRGRGYHSNYRGRGRGGYRGRNFIPGYRGRGTFRGRGFRRPFGRPRYK